jgi:hypothetical protein
MEALMYRNILRKLFMCTTADSQLAIDVTPPEKIGLIGHVPKDGLTAMKIAYAMPRPGWFLASGIISPRAQFIVIIGGFSNEFVD